MRISPPNYTQAPNELFDEWLPLLGMAELKVLMVIIRKTFGWHKVRDRISLSQLEQVTGLERRHVSKAVKSLQERKLIIKNVVGENGIQETFYELFIEDSNNFTQCPKDTPPSVFKTPTKETLTKENRSPIVPKGDPVSRKKTQEEKIQRAPEVFLTETQHKTLLQKCGGDEKLRELAYNELSDWKVGKGIAGGRNDFKACSDWAIDAARKKHHDNPTNKNQELLKLIQSKYPRHDHMRFGHNYIEFIRGTNVSHIKFSDPGFHDQVCSQLRKMNISPDDICK